MMRHPWKSTRQTRWLWTCKTAIVADWLVNGGLTTGLVARGSKAPISTRQGNFGEQVTAVLAGLQACMVLEGSWGVGLQHRATDNLVKMRELTEDNIVSMLSERYRDGIIYTLIGDILIACNPFKDLPIYTQKFQDVREGIERGVVYQLMVLDPGVYPQQRAVQPLSPRLWHRSSLHAAAGTQQLQPMRRHQVWGWHLRDTTAGG